MYIHTHVHTYIQKKYVALFGEWAFNVNPYSIFYMYPFKTFSCWTLCCDLFMSIPIDLGQLF